MLESLACSYPHQFVLVFSLEDRDLVWGRGPEHYFPTSLLSWDGRIFFSHRVPNPAPTSVSSALAVLRGHIPANFVLGNR